MVYTLKHIIIIIIIIIIKGRFTKKLPHDLCK